MSNPERTYEVITRTVANGVEWAVFEMPRNVEVARGIEAGILPAIEAGMKAAIDIKEQNDAIEQSHHDCKICNKKRADYLAEFDGKIQALIYYYREEFGFTPAEIVGGLEFIKADLIRETLDDEGDDFEGPDFPQAESPLIPPK